MYAAMEHGMFVHAAKADVLVLMSASVAAPEYMNFAAAMQEPQLCRISQSWATPSEMRPGLAIFPLPAPTPMALYTIPLTLATTMAPGMSCTAYMQEKG